MKSGFTSGVGGNLSLVVDGFWSKRFDGTIQETDIDEDLVVEKHSTCRQPTTLTTTQVQAAINVY